MRICVAQTIPVKGDIQKNIKNHKQLISTAVSYDADMVIFPELSLTGYEPGLSKELATTVYDSRLNDFQIISDSHHITIGVGLPTKAIAGTLISLVLFQPNQTRHIYSKEYLHPDEEEFFIKAQNASGGLDNKTSIAFAICYEISVPEHSESAFNSGATIYIASVAKSAPGVEKANNILSAIAIKYSMTVLMSNCVGQCYDFESGGRSAVWNNKGVLAAQLNDSNEGIIVFDTGTQAVIEKTV